MATIHRKRLRTGRVVWELTHGRGETRVRFVAGKTNTIYAWDTWQEAAAAEPKIWFHDIFRPDGTPFDAKEVELIKRETAVGAAR